LLCALAETLLIDSDGIYDPRLLNDRLLLGLKGSMAEFELGLLRQRAREAFEQKVKRGFPLWEVPVGFVRSEDGRIEKTADRQVQQAITTVFQKFRQLGSARQATIWFREEQIPLPHAKPGTAGREVMWALPSSGRIRQMLKNPCYAGAFAYGKTAPRMVIEEGRGRQRSRYRKPHNARQNQTKKALWELDNICRTIYILDFIDDSTLRQSVRSTEQAAPAAAISASQPYSNWRCPLCGNHAHRRTDLRRSTPAPFSTPGCQVRSMKPLLKTRSPGGLGHAQGTPGSFLNKPALLHAPSCGRTPRRDMIRRISRSDSANNHPEDGVRSTASSHQSIQIA
jgi:predicted RNA-binding Zn-ribbon protein involved in translation (DUF1610 family)